MNWLPDLPEAPTIDFSSGAIAYRLRAAGKEPLLRALGRPTPGSRPLIDATAGLGRDAIVAAAAGYEVILIERVPHLYDALASALERARAAKGPIAKAAGRMTLILGDSRLLLPTLRAEIVLVDPMHPRRRKTALVKKEMRLLREIAQADEDRSELLAVALASASRRVVLKWPARAPLPLGIRSPTFEVVGKTIRYTVFVTG